MDKKKNAREIRSEILSKYYSEIYQSYLFQKDAQGIGIRYFEMSLEKFWNKAIPEKVLEIGGGSGEHLPYINYIPGKSYTSVDIRDKFSDDHTFKLGDALIKK